MTRKRKSAETIDADPAAGWNQDKADLLQVLEELLPAFHRINKNLYRSARSATQHLKRQAEESLPPSNSVEVTDSDA